MDHDEQKPARRSPLRTWVPLLIAAVALVMVSVGLRNQYRKAVEGPLPVVPAHQGIDLESLLDVKVPLPRNAAALRWSNAGPGTRYDVLVTTRAGETLSSGAGLEKAEFLVPEESLAGVKPGGSIRWQVTAHLADGSTVRSNRFLAMIE